MEKIYKTTINGEETIIAKYNDIDGYVLLNNSFLLLDKNIPVTVETTMESTIIPAGVLFNIMSKQYIIDDDEFPEPHMSY